MSRLFAGARRLSHLRRCDVRDGEAAAKLDAWAEGQRAPKAKTERGQVKRFPAKRAAG